MTIEMSLEEMQSKVLNTFLDMFGKENSPLYGYNLKGVSMTHKTDNGLSLNFSFEKLEEQSK